MSEMTRQEVIRYGKYILEDLKEMPKPSEGYNQKRIGAQEALLSTAELVEEVVGKLKMVVTGIDRNEYLCRNDISDAINEILYMLTEGE